MSTDTRVRTHRARWAAIGAAVAVTLGAGTIATVDAVTSSGERTVYTAVTPCRLIDTRSDPQFNVGPKSSPLGPGEVVTVDARGAEGECPAASLPTDAVALALNVTALDATADGFLTFWADGPRPNAASLNPAPSQPPVPNAVTTEQAADGSFRVYNENGTVNVVIDVIGFYTDHNHDDRYYTKDELDARKEIQLPATSASLDNGATYSLSDGIIVPDGGVPGIAWSFVVPADHTAGTDITVDVLWSVGDDDCSVALVSDGSRIARPGAANASGTFVAPGQSASPGTDIVAITTYRFDASVDALAPGDAVKLGLFRQSGDSCVGDVSVFGAIARYS